MCGRPELNCFCELYSCLVTVEELAKKDLRGIVMSGGPASVYEEGAPHVLPEVWAFIRERRLPVLGICYGAQELVHAHGGVVERAVKREFGPAFLDVDVAGGLFDGFRDKSQVGVTDVGSAPTVAARPQCPSPSAALPPHTPTTHLIFWGAGARGYPSGGGARTHALPYLAEAVSAPAGVDVALGQGVHAA